MESRRDRFRRQLARLAGTGSPQEAIEAGLYVPRPTSSERLAKRIELQPAATRVLTGPIGSGKSTELLVLAKELNRLPDLWATVIDVSLVHDLGDLREGALLAAAGVWLESRLGMKGLHRFRKLAYEAPDLLADLHAVVNERERGVLRPPEQASSQTWELAEELGQGLTNRDELANRTPVLLFDSLDRVRDPAGFRTVLEKDARALTDHGIGVVLTAPVDTLWTNSEALRAIVDTWVTLPYEDPARNPAARSFLLAILEQRAEPDILPEAERNALIDASGGVLRDLIEMARSAVEEAYLDGRDTVGPGDVQAAITGMAHALSLGMGTQAFDLLAYVKSKRQIRVMNEETLRMLKNRQILEHRDDDGPYYSPHPVLEPLIERASKAS